MSFEPVVIIFQNHELYFPFKHSTTQAMLSSVWFHLSSFSLFYSASILNLSFRLCSNKSVKQTVQCSRCWNCEGLIESEWVRELDWQLERDFRLVSKPFPSNSNLVHIEFKLGKLELDFILYSKISCMIQKSWLVFVLNQFFFLK